MSCIDHAPESHEKFRRPLPLAALEQHLPDGQIEQICHELGHTWRDRRFPPGVTVRSCVHRALNGDHSIAATLADLAALEPPGTIAPTDSAWCQARSRIPLTVFRELIARGRRLGRNEWIVPLELSPQLRRQYDDPTSPQVLRVRLIRVRFRRGSRWQTLWVVTTLMDPVRYPRRQIVAGYRWRWGIEGRIGSLKTTLEMNVLRSKSPGAARREVASIVLGHNLVWMLIHEAAERSDTPAGDISFAGAVKVAVAFSQTLVLAS